MWSMECNIATGKNRNYANKQTITACANQSP